VTCPWTSGVDSEIESDAKYAGRPEVFDFGRYEGPAVPDKSNQPVV